MHMSRILFVEDDPFISEIYTKKFEASGFEVVSALTGKEALKKIRESLYDVVLLDMVLPELSGMEVLHELQAGKEFDAGLKVVVFSNLSGPQERQEALAAGASGFISKTDFTPSEVVAEVRRYLEQFASQEKHAGLRSAAAMIGENVLSVSDPLPEPGTEKRILLVEDEPVFVEMFGKALRNAGYAVVVESDGKTGLERAKTGGFDLIITDHLLPSMSGKEIIETLRADEESKSFPIFLLTASLEEEEVKALETTGAVKRSFLKTKVTPSELAAAVSDFFAEHSA
ncbi:MAG: response regulator [Candidatus Moraniibacteriota bacterium]|nr:MAG: response regulator [Candidatus Moranbacteria bacterium]